MRLFISILLIMSFFVFSGVRIYKGVVFDINCEGNLKRAADANTVDIAKKELKTAIKYLEDNKITTGYTSVLYKSPDEDIEFFYNNLVSSFKELENVTENTSQLEKTNILMKLRETLLDNGKDGSSVTIPEGISIHPNNTAYAIFGWGSLFWSFVGVILFFVWLDEL